MSEAPEDGGIYNARKLARSLRWFIEEVAFVVVDGEPRSKARPRFTSGGKVYSDKKQVAHAKGLAWAFRSVIKSPLDGGCALVCSFFLSDYRRIDVDNLLKQVLDAANKVVFHDDYQVSAVLGVACVDEERPRTEILIGRVSGLRVPRENAQQARCATCGKEFTWRRRRSVRERTYCSRVCGVRATKIFSKSRCLACGQVFHRLHANSTLCSEQCRVAWLAERNRGARKYPPAACLDCGSRLSRPNYVLCRGCFLKRASAQRAGAGR